MNSLEKYGFSDRFKNESTLYPELSPARITAQHKGLYDIITDMGEMHAEISGKMRYKANELTQFPAVGDFVMVEVGSDTSNAIIHHILRRKSIFLRTAVGVSGQAQVVATNIDTVFICMSLNQNFNLSRMERYLSVAWDSGAVPVILLTKSDLCEDLAKAIEQVEQISNFSDVIATSMFDDDTEEKLARYLGLGTTSAFIGSSGVGKSTIVNKLLRKDVITTASIGKSDKGRHTTTSREMFSLPFGGVLIDTPGMRELGAESADVSKTFSDVEELTELCKFQDCGHTNEPGCAILQALEDGTLDIRRFKNYQKLKNESSYEGLSTKEIEIKKWERFGGVKNLRKIGDEYRKEKYRGSR